MSLSFDVKVGRKPGAPSVIMAEIKGPTQITTVAMSVQEAAEFAAMLVSAVEQAAKPTIARPDLGRNGTV